MTAQSLDGRIGLLGGNDRQELAFVGDVQRVDSEQVTGPGDRGINWKGGFVQHDGQASVVGQLVADGPDTTAGRVSSQRVDGAAENKASTSSLTGAVSDFSSASRARSPLASITAIP